MEIHRLLLLCTTFCLVQSVTYSVENINESNSDEPKDTPSWKIIETADEEEGKLPYVEEKTPVQLSVEYKIPTSSPNAASKTINTEEEETKPKRSPNEYVIEITEEEPKAPPYLASNGKPKQYTDEYGKFVEPEEIGNCNLPSYTGPCRGRLRRFYYDAESGECQIFRYGGCRGNANNFKTEKACKEFRRYCLSVHN